MNPLIGYNAVTSGAVALVNLSQRAVPNRFWLAQRFWLIDKQQERGSTVLREQKYGS